jgi:hypothetical protein
MINRLLVLSLGDVDPQGAFAVVGMTVGDVKGAGISASVFAGLYTFYNRIQTNILHLANPFKFSFVTLKILRAFEVVDNFSYFFLVLLFHFKDSSPAPIYVTHDTKRQILLKPVKSQHLLREKRRQQSGGPGTSIKRPPVP